MSNPSKNPVVHTTRINAYPTFRIREYADGTFDAFNYNSLSGGFATFADALAWCKREDEIDTEYCREHDC